jgi:hypothetical protein
MFAEWRGAEAVTTWKRFRRLHLEWSRLRSKAALLGRMAAERGVENCDMLF